MGQEIMMAVPDSNYELKTIQLFTES